MDCKAPGERSIDPDLVVVICKYIASDRFEKALFAFLGMAIGAPELHKSPDFEPFGVVVGLCWAFAAPAKPKVVPRKNVSMVLEKIMQYSSREVIESTRLA